MIFLVILYALSLLWILHRLFVQHSFLVWDWSDGKMEYVWNKSHEEEY